MTVREFRCADTLIITHLCLLYIEYTEAIFGSPVALLCATGEMNKRKEQSFGCSFIVSVHQNWLKTNYHRP
jgi:hypothetical protein